MRDSVYDEFNIAKKNNDIDMVEKLYMENPNESIIGICYAKMLLKKRINVEVEKAQRELDKIRAKSNNFSLNRDNLDLLIKNQKEDQE